MHGCFATKAPIKLAGQRNGLSQIILSTAVLCLASGKGSVCVAYSWNIAGNIVSFFLTVAGTKLLISNNTTPSSRMAKGQGT